MSWRGVIDKKKLLLLFLLPVFWLVSEQQLSACTTPVFHFAMIMWEQDVYSGLLIFDGALSAEEQKGFTALQNATTGNHAINLELHKMDIASEKRSLKKILNGNMPEELPALYLWYPYQKGRTPAFWSGKFSNELAQQLTQSPLNEEISGHLLRGAPIVWVMLMSGNKEKDLDASGIVERELKKVTGELSDDPQSPGFVQGFPEGYNPFPLVSIPPTDSPGKTILPVMLRSYFPELKDLREPLLFPVFGKGRALDALQGEEITPENIQDIISFLLNPCACQVKMDNPGFDLMMGADWNSYVAHSNQEVISPLMSGVMPDTIMITAFEDIVDLTNPARKSLKSRILTGTALIIAGAIALLSILTLVIIRRR